MDKLEDVNCWFLIKTNQIWAAESLGEMIKAYFRAFVGFSANMGLKFCMKSAQ